MHPSAIYLLVLISAVSATAQRIVPEAGSDINKQFAMGADLFSLAMFELDSDDMEADEATWIEKLQSIQRTVRAKCEGSTPSYTSIDPEDVHDESGALLHELL